MQFHWNSKGFEQLKMKKQTRFQIVIVLIWICLSNALKWIHGEIGICSFNFKASPREKYRNSHIDPLILWLGAPSTALQVQGKFGLLPIPTVWGSYANVLYCHCPVSTEQEYVTTIHQFLDSWCAMQPYSSYCQRQLYLTGNYLDMSGGKYLADLALSLSLSQSQSELKIPQPKLRGIALGFSPFTPATTFVPHKSFETANDLNFWTIDRARKPAMCNTQMQQVEFLQHDVKLTYSPAAPTQTAEERNRGEYGNEMFEYELCSVATWDRCYTDAEIDEFADYFTHKPRIPYEEFHAALAENDGNDAISKEDMSSNTHTPQFPNCGCSKPHAQHDIISRQINVLLNANVTVLLYNSIRKHHKPLCSFYIGIFGGDGLRIDFDFDDVGRDNQGTQQGLAAKVISSFNNAALEEMPPTWNPAIGQGSDSSVPGTIQRSNMIGNNVNANNGITAGAELIWMQFDASVDSNHKPNNKDSQRSSQRSSYAVLSKAGALDILFHLLDKESEVDFIELYVMDHIDSN